MSTPAIEDRFAADSHHLEAGFTPEQWAAVVHSPMSRRAAAIWEALDDAVGLMRGWLADHGAGDPAVAALEAAGLPVPGRLAEWGSPWDRLAEEYRGLIWAVTRFTDLHCEEPPDPSEYDPAGLWLHPNTRPPEPPEPPEPKLVGADGARIIAALRAVGPAPAMAVVMKSGVERTRAYVLLSDLVERGLIVEGPDGFSVADVPGLADLRAA